MIKCSRLSQFRGHDLFLAPLFDLIFLDSFPVWSSTQLVLIFLDNFMKKIYNFINGTEMLHLYGTYERDDEEPEEKDFEHEELMLEVRRSWYIDCLLPNARMLTSLDLSNTQPYYGMLNFESIKMIVQNRFQLIVLLQRSFLIRLPSHVQCYCTCTAFRSTSERLRGRRHHTVISSEIPKYFALFDMTGLSQTTGLEVLFTPLR